MFLTCHRPSSACNTKLFADEVIDATLHAFEIYSAEMVNDIFLTLQSIILLVIQENGGNKYKLPHMGKGKMKADGTLPHVLIVPQATYDAANEFIAMAFCSKNLET